jgi:hypothetical protein
MTDVTNLISQSTKTASSSRSTGGGSIVIVDSTGIPPYGPPRSTNDPGSSSAQFTATGIHWSANTASKLTSSAATATAMDPSISQCDNWIGVEIIHMVEVVEVCPEGSTGL